MTVSDGTKTVAVWSETAANRIAPDDASLTPPIVIADGFDSRWSDVNGLRPRRTHINWLLWGLTSGVVDLRSRGVLEFDADVDTLHPGIRQVNGVLYRTTVNIGPSYNNAVSPTAAGQTLWEEVAGTIGLPSAPAAPQATTPTSGELDWFWSCPLDGGARVTEFLVQTRTAGSSGWSASTTVNTARYTQTGLSNGQAVEAQVAAVNSQGTGPWSTTGTATPSGTVPGGGSTLALRTVGGDGEVGLDWLEPDDGGVSITSYLVQWRTMTQTFSSGRQSSVTDTAATVSSLTNDTQYFFQVRAVNGEGNGTWSNEETSTPAAVVPDTAIPDRAAAPSSSVRSGEATWVWAAPSDNGADISSYEFRFRRTGTTSWIPRVVGLPSRTETGLTNGQTYEAQIRATNSVGQQPQWSPSGQASPEAAVPDQVGLVALINTASGIETSWAAPENNGATISSYTVQIANNSAFTARTEVSTTQLTRTFTGLSDGVTYFVRVRAVNTAGAGAWSPTVSLQRDDGVAAPSAPTGLAGMPRRPAIIDWVWAPGADNGAVASSYLVQWRQAGQAWSSTREAVVSVPFHRVPGLDVSVDHEARVRATNTGGTGFWSSTATVDSADLIGPTTRTIVVSQSDNSIRDYTADGYGVITIVGQQVIHSITVPAHATSTGLLNSTAKIFQITGLNDGDVFSVRSLTFTGPDRSYWMFPQPETA